MSEVCQICDYSINQSTRKKVSCPFCEFDACKKCCETYVLGESSFKCMNTQCTREWTRQFISTAFTNTFINGKLKTHREQLLFDIERALLPATQVKVERIIEIENLEKKLCDIKKDITELYIQRNETSRQIYQLRYNSHNESTVARVEFIKACPNSNCRGFLSSQWKCGICEQWSCPTCHEIKGDSRDSPHECNPDTVASVSLLVNDTKPCPNCRTRIFKISGCDEMYCTHCNTGFNWRTGRVQTAVHNPHYFEWLRRNGNVVPVNQNPCNNQLTHTVYQNLKRMLTGKHQGHYLSKTCDQFLSILIRNTIHMRYEIMGRYTPEERVGRNERLRIQYMRNQIAETQFKLLLQRNEKKVEKAREIHNVLEILLNTITDIIFRFSAHLIEVLPGEFVLDILEEIDPIVEYANGCLYDISKVYNSKQIKFSNEMAEK